MKDWKKVLKHESQSDRPPGLNRSPNLSPCCLLIKIKKFKFSKAQHHLFLFSITFVSHLSSRMGFKAAFSRSSGSLTLRRRTDPDLLNFSPVAVSGAFSPDLPQPLPPLLQRRRLTALLGTQAAQPIVNPTTPSLQPIHELNTCTILQFQWAIMENKKAKSNMMDEGHFTHYAEATFGLLPSTPSKTAASSNSSQISIMGYTVHV